MEHAFNVEEPNKNDFLQTNTHSNRLGDKNAIMEICKLHWRNSPRVYGPMADAFRNYVTGIKQPNTSPLIEKDPTLFKNDDDLLQFRDTYLQHCGIFKHHFVSNIPNVYQEDCSLGVAFTAYLKEQSELRHGAPVSLWTIGNSEGVISRSVAHLGQGQIYTLNNNETLENEKAFNEAKPSNAYFLGGPFCDLTSGWLAEQDKSFPNKFAVIHENLSFQMIQDNRREQLAYVSQFLEDDGVFTSIEKCNIPDDVNEYRRREDIKDTFKSRYFNQDAIQYDSRELISFMERNQVSLEHLIDETERLYPHIAIIWNSCNFYTIVASKNANNVKRFCNYFYPPYIEEQFICLEINQPIKARGLEGMKLSFREPHVRLLG